MTLTLCKDDLESLITDAKPKEIREKKKRKGRNKDRALLRALLNCQVMIEGGAGMGLWGTRPLSHRAHYLEMGKMRQEGRQEVSLV